jgi:hypothetical protein
MNIVFSSDTLQAIESQTSGTTYTVIPLSSVKVQKITSA